MLSQKIDTVEQVLKKIQFYFSKTNNFKEKTIAIISTF